MSINDSYNEEAIVEAIAVALDNFYTNLIKKVDSLNNLARRQYKPWYRYRVLIQNHHSGYIPFGWNPPFAASAPGRCWCYPDCTTASSPHCKSRKYQGSSAGFAR